MESHPLVISTQDKITATQKYKQEPVFSNKRINEAIKKHFKKSGALWIAAPAGYGKSTTVRNYLNINCLEGFWYNFIEEDADFASFINRFTATLRQHRKFEDVCLPTFTPEYKFGVIAFIRHYFQIIYNTAPNAVFVFDNYHLLENDTCLHEIMVIVARELLPDNNVVLISRQQPPACFAKLQLDGLLSLLPPATLLLTEIETEEFLESEGLDHPNIDELSLQIFNYTNGWITGVRLLARADNFSDQIDASTYKHNNKLLFDYFASEYFKFLNTSTKEVLLTCAVLRKIYKNLLPKLFPTVDSISLFDELAKTRMFATSDSDNKPCYLLQPMFRDFLMDYSKRHFSDKRIKENMVRLAASLAQCGYIEEAGNLFADASISDELEKIIMAHAEHLIQQGRYTVLNKWLEVLPLEFRNNKPWLIFFQGMCELHERPSDSRATLESAFTVFEASHNTTGLYASWAMLIRSYILEWKGFQSAHRWIEKFDMLFASEPHITDKRLLAKVTSAFISICSFTKPQHPQLATWVENAESMFVHSENSELQAMMCLSLSPYYIWMGKSDKLNLLTNISATLLTRDNISPLSKVVFYLASVSSSWMLGDPEKSVNIAHNAIGYCKSRGLLVLQFELMSQCLMALIALGKLKEAQKLFEEIKRLKPHFREMEIGHLHYLQGLLHLFNNKAQKAEKFLEQALEAATDSKFVFPAALVASKLIQSYIIQGKYLDADSLLQEIEKLSLNTGSLHCKLLHRLLSVWMYIRQNNVRQSLSMLDNITADDFNKHDAYAVSLLYPEMLFEIAKFCLDHDIKETGNAMINHFKIKPDSNNMIIANWPYPVRIVSLGDFQLIVNNKPVVFTRKSQKKPLELIKVLIAHGGKNVSSQKVTETIWPDAEGDAAYDVLKTTLQRLRTLMGSKDAIHLIDGKITINPHICWVDIWELQQLFQTRNAETYNAKRVVTLYKAEFLCKDLNSPWAQPMRNKMRDLFRTLIMHSSNNFEAEGKWTEAMELYHYGLEVDDLYEGFYQGLMQYHAQHDERPSVKLLYEQCTKTLQQNLNVPPSAKTKEIYSKICNADSYQMLSKSKARSNQGHIPTKAGTH